MAECNRKMGQAVNGQRNGKSAPYLACLSFSHAPLCPFVCGDQHLCGIQSMFRLHSTASRLPFQTHAATIT